MTGEGLLVVIDQLGLQLAAVQAELERFRAQNDQLAAALSSQNERGAT